MGFFVITFAWPEACSSVNEIPRMHFFINCFLMEMYALLMFHSLINRAYLFI